MFLDRDTLVFEEVVCGAYLGGGVAGGKLPDKVWTVRPGGGGGKSKVYLY